MSSADEGGIVADGAARWLEGEMIAVDAKIQSIDERLAVETDADVRARLTIEREALESKRRDRRARVVRESNDALF